MSRAAAGRDAPDPPAPAAVTALAGTAVDTVFGLVGATVPHQIDVLLVTQRGSAESDGRGEGRHDAGMKPLHRLRRERVSGAVGSE